MTTEFTGQCRSCHIHLILDLPAAWQAPDGTMHDAEQTALEDHREHMRLFMADFQCPRCKHTGFEITGEQVITKETFPVYIGYTLYLERYVEVPVDQAETMEQAMALVKRLAAEGKIQAPRYTEGLDDWTEITDLPNARSHFRIDGKVIIPKEREP